MHYMDSGRHCRSDRPFLENNVLFGWISGSRESLFIDTPNLEISLLNSPEGNVEEVAGYSYRGRTHWAEGHPRLLKAESEFPACPRGRGRKDGWRWWWNKRGKGRVPINYSGLETEAEGTEGGKEGRGDRRSRGRRGGNARSSGRSFFFLWCFPEWSTSTLFVCVRSDLESCGYARSQSLCVLSLGRDYCLLLGCVTSQHYYSRCWTGYLNSVCVI